SGSIRCEKILKCDVMSDNEEKLGNTFVASCIRASQFTYAESMNDRKRRRRFFDDSSKITPHKNNDNGQKQHNSDTAQSI
ncbi:hypothetical protein ACV2I9_21105, partial [Salmonella enterica subsp. enterica serovar Sandiego]